MHSAIGLYITTGFALLIVLTGVVFNIFIVYIICKNPRMKGENHVLIANLAIADLLQSLNMTFMVLSLFNGGKWMLEHITCQINAFLIIEFLLAAMFTICAISVNRYAKIVKPRWYSRLFNDDTIGKIIVLIWMLPLAFAIPPLLGWSRYEFDAGKCICFFRTDHVGSYGLTVGVVTMGINVPIIMYCYFWVFKVVGIHSVRMTKLRSRRSSELSSNIEEIRITRTLLVVMATFILCFLPGTLVVVIEVAVPGAVIPAWVELLGVMLVFANQAIDPIIYGFFNTQYRRAMFQLWTRRNARRGQQTNVNSTEANVQNSITIHGRYSVGGALLVLFIATENELLRYNASMKGTPVPGVAELPPMGMKRRRLSKTDQLREALNDDDSDS